LDPFAPLAIGAWLSFVAVAVILLAAGGQLAREGTLRNFTRVQWAVTVGMAPVVILAFNTLSLIAPIANALAVPLFTLLLVPVVLVGTVLAAFSLPAGGVLLDVATQVLAFCWPGLAQLANHPLAVWHTPTLPLPMIVALLAGAWLLISPAIWPMRVAALLLCVPAIAHRPAVPLPGEFELVVLDVGQGLAIGVRTRSHTLVYDTGPAFRSGRDTGELVVLPFLHSLGVREINLLMGSHDDLDHSGGLLTLLRGMPTRAVLLGPSFTPAAVMAAQSVARASLQSAADKQINIDSCRRGQQWKWDGVAFEVLHPGSGIDRTDNDSSCVLRITGSGGSALLTGDVESAAEGELVEHGLAAAEVVVVAHHGSRSSSTPALVNVVRAKLAVFSAGYRNRWKFPKPEVVARWQRSGATPVSTIDSGAILITMTAQGVTGPIRYRDTHRHYWSAR
jgi:competence protein ComEC